VSADLSSMDGSYASAGYTNRVEYVHLSTTLVSQTYPRTHAVAVALLPCSDSLYLSDLSRCLPDPCLTLIH
jgi:hypothetical protein